MPPKTRSSHLALDPPPRQTKLSARRTTLVHRRRMSPPRLKTRDSTLTQLGFHHSSSPAVETQWTMPVTSDAKDEDEACQEPRAKKRRKTAGRKASKASKAAGGKMANRHVSESQSTLTQNWRALGYAVDSYDTSDEEDRWMVDEGMQPPPSAQPKQIRPLPRRRPAPDAGETQIQGDNLLGAYLDIDCSSESELDAATNPSLPPSQLAHLARCQQKDSRGLTTAHSDATPNTPKRITKTEIPDSAETSSIATSSRSAKAGPGYVRSPLKERSTNVPSSQGLSGNSEKDDRDEVSFSQVQLDDANALKETVGPWSAKLAYTPKRSHKTRTRSPQSQRIASSPTLGQSTGQKSGMNARTARKRTFERVSTIAESEDSDVELGDIEPIRFGSNSRQRAQSAYGDNIKLPSQKWGSNGPDPAVDEEIETLPLTAGLDAAVAESLPVSDEHTEMEIEDAATRASIEESPSLSQDNGMTAGDLAPPQAKATEEAVAIEDSEAEEEFGGEDDDYTDDDLDGRPDDHNDYDDDEEYAYNQTYDPVADALARDGARAWRTETQLQRDELEKTKSEALVEESDAEIEERNENQNIVAVPSSQEEEEIVPSSQDFADPGQKLAALGSPGRTTAGDLDDSGYASQEMLKDESSKAPPQSMLPPSKPQQPLPELPRPSQVSTVVDTQSQRSRPYSPHGMPQPWTEQSAPSSPDVDVGLPDDPIERSPHKSYPQTLSSSPFPMPPGFTRRARGDYTETQSSELMDFSLPPPPPLLLSSSRPQDGSSSR